MSIHMATCYSFKYATYKYKRQTHNVISTVALRVVRGDGRGAQCLGVYLGHPWNINTGTSPLGLSRIGTIKYGLESRGTQTRAGLRWRGPAATVNYRPVLSSERALQNNKPANCLMKISRKNKDWSRVPDRCLTPRWTGRLTVSRNITLTMTLFFYNSHNIYSKRGFMFYDRNTAYHVIEAKYHWTSLLSLDRHTTTYNIHDRKLVSSISQNHYRHGLYSVLTGSA
jgi:hypothetical protein